MEAADATAQVALQQVVRLQVPRHSRLLLSQERVQRRQQRQVRQPQPPQRQVR